MAAPTWKLSRREFLGWAAASAVGGAALLAEACGRARARTVSFLNWAGYIGKDTLSRFEAETGIAVNYDFYSQEDALLAKLAAAPDGYDLAVAPDLMIPKLKAQGLLARVPHERLKSLDNIAPRFRAPAYDPGLSYTVPYLWGTTGLGVDTHRLPAPPDSWRALWDARYKGRLSMLDNEREALQCALLLLGLPLDAREPGQLAKAGDLLRRQRPLLKEYNSSTYADELAAEQLWLAQAWSGDVLLLASQGKKVDFVIPREGSFIWMDGLCLPRGSRRKDEALRLLDFLLQPDIAAGIANTTRYATPNEKALPLLAPSLRDDPRAFPPEATLARLRFAQPLDAQAEKLWARAWAEARA